MYQLYQQQQYDVAAVLVVPQTAIFSNTTVLLAANYCDTSEACKTLFVLQAKAKYVITLFGELIATNVSWPMQGKAIAQLMMNTDNTQPK